MKRVWEEVVMRKERELSSARFYIELGERDPLCGSADVGASSRSRDGAWICTGDSEAKSLTW